MARRAISTRTAPAPSASRGTASAVAHTEAGGPLNRGNVERTWRVLRSRASLDDVRLHDLRHSAASDALAAGVPLAIVGRILGHGHARATQRYAHLSDDVIRAAAATMGAAIETATREGAKVVTLPITKRPEPARAPKRRKTKSARA